MKDNMTERHETKDRRLLKGREMREKILYATLKLVGESGLPKLSARNLAEKIGISKANLFHHFKNMQEIRVEACLYFLTIIRPPFFNHAYDDAKKFLIDLQNGVADFLEKNKTLNTGYGILCTNESRTNPDFSTYIDNKVQDNKGMVKKKLRKILDLDENNSQTEDILFALDVMREGVNVYISETSLQRKALRAWEVTVDLALEKLKNISK